MQYSNKPSVYKHCIIKLDPQNTFDQGGWKLTAHSHYSQDKRDKVSTYACAHRDNYSCQTFCLIPFGSHYKIALADNFFLQAGWNLTAHLYHDKDRRDDGSVFAFFHKEPQSGQTWSPLCITSLLTKKQIRLWTTVMKLQTISVYIRILEDLSGK